MIHETASVHPEASLDETVVVDAFAVIGAGVVIGAGCQIGAHAVLEGPTTLGRDNIIGPHVVLGAPPQDRSYKREPTRLEIGDRNTIREFATLHRASTKEQWVTRIGNDNLLMTGVHVGHDCVVGNNVTLANNAMLGGHVTVEDNVNMSALCGIHQFVRIGAYAMIGGGTMTTKDIAPFCMVSGNHGRLYGLNRRGLQRGGIPAEEIRQIRTAYRLLFRAGLRLEQAADAINNDSALNSLWVEHLLSFIRESKRGLIR